MSNLFWYTRTEGEKSVKDFVNLSKIIRGVTLDDDRLLLLMDDLHQRPQEVEVKNKQGKVTAIKREMNIFQSEIFLSETDAARFYKLTNTEI